MSSFSLRKQDPVLFTGIYAVLISFGISAGTELIRVAGTARVTRASYGVSLFIAAGYFVILLAGRRLKKGNNVFFPLLLLLLLGLNSAYALNREWKWFEIPSAWYCLGLIFFCGNYIAISVFTRIPAWIRYSLFAIAGTAICLLCTIKMNNIL